MLRMLGEVSLSVFLTVGILATTAYGATTDFVADGNVTVDDVVYGSLTSDLLIMSGSKAESWSLDSGNFSVLNPDPSAFFSVGSSETAVKSVRVKSGTDEVLCANNTVPGTSYVSLPISAGNYAVYQSADLCSASATSGSGGGGSNKKKSTTMPTIPVATPPVVPVLPQVPANPMPSPSAWLNASPRERPFLRSLSFGITGADVRSLQEFLNSHGFTVAPTGPGSSGQETTYFGPATKSALIKFQLANGIIQIATDDGAGRVGPLTRAKLNELSATGDVSREVLIQSLTARLQVLRVQLELLLRNQ